LDLSHPESHTSFFLFENLYTSTRSSFYNLISGSGYQEYRKTETGQPLYHCIENYDGSGWFLCLNIKYHPPHQLIDHQSLLNNANFIAWWIAPYWLPNIQQTVKRMNEMDEWTHTNLTSITSMSAVNWSASDNIQPILNDSSHTQQIIHTPPTSSSTSIYYNQKQNNSQNYFCTIRDCSDHRLYENLWTKSKKYFENLLNLKKRNISFENYFEVMDAHYPPALKYGTLHFHFRHQQTFSLSQFSMRFPLQKLIIFLRQRTSMDDDDDGSDTSVVRSASKDPFRNYLFYYPHHTGRVVYQLYLKNHNFELKLLNLDARAFATGQFYAVDDLKAGEEEEE
jgi:hypothetical protein